MPASVKAGQTGAMRGSPGAAPGKRMVAAIDALLPQTQCMRCGFDACGPYAQAVAAGEAPINRCPPGGTDTIRALAGLLGKPTLPLDPDCGAEGAPLLARIEEAWCIGCTLCIAACPVDAIVGARKCMHSVLAEECTGCELCVAPCPMDCIKMRPAPIARWSGERAARARRRYERRRERLTAVPEKAATRARRRRAAMRDASPGEKRASIVQALERVRQRREKGTEKVPGLFFSTAGAKVCRAHKKK